jgi:hypothetical protein
MDISKFLLPIIGSFICRLSDINQSIVWECLLLFWWVISFAWFPCHWICSACLLLFINCDLNLLFAEGCLYFYFRFFYLLYWLGYHLIKFYFIFRKSLISCWFIVYSNFKKFQFKFIVTKIVCFFMHALLRVGPAYSTLVGKLICLWPPPFDEKRFLIGKSKLANFTSIFCFSTALYYSFVRIIQ